MKKQTNKKYLIKKDKVDELIVFSSKTFGLPKAGSSLGMYTEYQDKILEVTFINSTCYLQRHNKYSNIDQKFIELFSETPPIKIDNKNIKYFLRIINDLEFSNAYISDEVVQLKFLNDDDMFSIKLNIGTPIGDILVIDNNLKVEKVLKKRFYEEEISFGINKRFEEVQKEKIFDDNNILNQKIIQYGDKYGIDLISSGRVNIKSLLSNKSNNYSIFSKYFQKILPTCKKVLHPISIIIPLFNSNDTIIQVLTAIESQDLPKTEKKKIEVVIVDDGSDALVIEVLKEIIKKLSFSIKVIRLEKQLGLSNARNIGVAAAKNKNLLFLDSDILISQNYLYEHSNAIHFFPDAVFVSMKKNIERDSELNDIKKISKGLLPPKECDDKRLSRVSEKGNNWVNEISLDGVYEIVSNTDSFNNFGHGRIINGFDLASMVVGHNMSINKNMFLKVGGFSEEFIGWGLEDTYFGARLISEGGFVIPILNCGVYHINHPPRSGSLEKQEKEYAENLKTYKNLINKEI